MITSSTNTEIFEMAYMDQEKKAIIKAAIQKVLPKDWKFSLSVKNSMKIVCCIKSAPFDIKNIINIDNFYENKFDKDYLDINQYQIDQHFIECEERDILKKLIIAMNTGNYDNSDVQSDHFDVGHYIGISFGKFGKPFVNNSK